MFFANFSKDHQYQLLNALTNNSFEYFDSRELDIKIYSFFKIDKTLNQNYIFEVETYKNTLTEYLSNLVLTQAHIFESIK